MVKINVECEDGMQSHMIQALAQSFEGKRVNMDKFLFWVLKTYEPGTSLLLTMLKNMGENDATKQ